MWHHYPFQKSQVTDILPFTNCVHYINFHLCFLFKKTYFPLVLQLLGVLAFSLSYRSFKNYLMQQCAHVQTSDCGSEGRYTLNSGQSKHLPTHRRHLKVSGMERWESTGRSLNCDFENASGILGKRKCRLGAVVYQINHSSLVRDWTSHILTCSSFVSP
jgi:hypothetical protein